MPSCFPDRRAAGQALARMLSEAALPPNTVVLALPRGGVPVGLEIARALGVPLDVFMVRKLGVPGHEELAFGAIASGGTRVLNPDIVQHLGLSEVVMEQVTRQEIAELHRRERVYRGLRPPLEARGLAVILVDDGLATGATMRAAVAAVRAQGASSVVVAVPVAAPATCALFECDVDQFFCALRPEPFESVGQWYLDFSQTTDEEVRAALEGAEG